MFRFYMRAVEKDESGYHHVNWNDSIPVEVIARDKSSAIKIAINALGEPERYPYSFKLDKVEELVNSTIK